MKLDGKSLERATKLIETHILKHIIESDIGKVKIDTNKIVTIDGVRNEVDIYVTVDLKIGTSLIYIFECKNYRSKKVNKNDIILFEDKIKITNAQKGYFVAKSYTKDARNRTATNNNIELLTLDNENSKIFDPDYFLQIESAYIKNCSIKITVTPEIPFEKKFEFLTIIHSDQKKQTIHDLVLEKVLLGNPIATKYRTSDDHHKGKLMQSDQEKVETMHSERKRWTFKIHLKDPIMNGIQYKWIWLLVDVEYEIETPQIIFEYNIKEKGHYVKLRSRGLLPNQYSIAELTKDDKTNEIKIHNITFE